MNTYTVKTALNARIYGQFEIEAENEEDLRKKLADVTMPDVLEWFYMTGSKLDQDYVLDTCSPEPQIAMLWADSDASNENEQIQLDLDL